MKHFIINNEKTHDYEMEETEENKEMMKNKKDYFGKTSL